MSTLYRLTRAKGKARYLDSQLLDALCDVLKVEPGDLLERRPARRRGGHQTAPKKARRQTRAHPI